MIRQFRPTQTRRPDQTVAANSVLPERRKEKENMADFIAKKREIFLLQVCECWRSKGAGSDLPEVHRCYGTFELCLIP